MVAEIWKSPCITVQKRISIASGQYHQWQGIPGTGDVILFEVSATNDDNVDNRFHEIRKRIPDVEEDEPAKYLMFADYKN